jgi:hypothetical protein
MGEYPPKVVGMAGTAFGSVLTLSDGRVVPIDIGPERLSQALLAFERPPLSELLVARSLGVYADTWAMTAEDWQRISGVVRASPVAAAAFRQAPAVWEMFGQPAASVRELPQRVYGGLAGALHLAPIPVPAGPEQARPVVSRPAQRVGRPTLQHLGALGQRGGRGRVRRVGRPLCGVVIGPNSKSGRRSGASG